MIFSRRVLLHPTTGKRFIDESLPRDPLANASLKIAEETDRFPVAISDAEALRHFEDPHRNERQLKLGSLREYPSLEALCKAEKLPFKTTKQTLAEYNAGVRAGKDEAFRKDIMKVGALPLEKAPFYASALIPRANNTVGGMLVTPKAEVVGVADSKPIRGLYAAGEIIGGLHGAQYLGGCGFSSALTFGRLAGRNAAKAKA